MNDGLDSLAPAMMPLCPRSHPHRSHAYMQLRQIQGCQPTHDYLQCGGGPHTTFPRMYKYIYADASLLKWRNLPEVLMDQDLMVIDYPQVSGKNRASLVSQIWVIVSKKILCLFLHTIRYDSNNTCSKM